MPTFKYRARMPDGRMQAGIIEADSQQAAQDALVERGLEVFLVELNTGGEASARRFELFLNPVKPKDLVVATRTLSVMVSASVPLTDAVRNIAKQTENPQLRVILGDVASEIEGGAKLSDALERHPKVFSGFFINMVRSGETTGQLAEVLEYLADQQEKDYDLNGKIKGAMIYPAFIMSTMGVVGFVMMAFVVPKLTAVLSEAGVALPLSTRMLIAVSGFMQTYWYLVVLATVGAVVGFRAWTATSGGRYAWDGIKMRIPIFGGLFRNMYVVRFARSLSTLTKGGVDLVNALEVVSGVIGNAVWKQVVFETIREVNDGNSIVTAFQRHSFVPTMMVQMLQVGEGTGRTSDILARLSGFYSREIDNVVDNLAKLIEPIVIVILGIGVGVLVSAIMLPLYQMSSGAGVG